MSTLTKLLKISDSDEKAVKKIMLRLEANKTPVRVEIEGKNIHFYTVFSMKRNLVVAAKPQGLQKELTRDGTVRFRVPDEEDKEIRLDISVPHFNLLSGSYVFLCTIPKQFAEQSKRGADRFNTSRFNNLFLVIPHVRKRFRIVDMSRSGCKIFTNHKINRVQFQLGETIEKAYIEVGGKVDIQLESAIARARDGTTVGFQVQISEADNSAKYMAHFIKSLETAETASYGVETEV